MKVPTISLRLMSLNFSMVHKLVREKGVILVHFLWGRWVWRMLAHRSFCSSVMSCAAQAGFGLLTLSIWCRRGLLLGVGPPHPSLHALESWFPQMQATMGALVIWWASLALGDRISEASLCLYLDHTSTPSPGRVLIRCRLPDLQRWLTHSDFTIWEAQTHEHVNDEKQFTLYSLLNQGNLQCKKRSVVSCLYVFPCYIHLYHTRSSLNHNYKCLISNAN